MFVQFTEIYFIPCVFDPSEFLFLKFGPFRRVLQSHENLQFQLVERLILDLFLVIAL